MTNRKVRPFDEATAARILHEMAGEEAISPRVPIWVGPCPPSKADKALADKLARRWFKAVVARLRRVLREKP